MIKDYIRYTPDGLGFSDKEEQYLSNLVMKDHPRGNFPMSPGYERVLAHRIAKKIPKILRTLNTLHLAMNNAPPALQTELYNLFSNYNKHYPE